MEVPYSGDSTDSNHSRLSTSPDSHCAVVGDYSHQVTRAGLSPLQMDACMAVSDPDNLDHHCGFGYWEEETSTLGFGQYSSDSILGTSNSQSGDFAISLGASPVSEETQHPMPVSFAYLSFLDDWDASYSDERQVYLGGRLSNSFNNEI
jgi:hypothetical protein